MADSSFRKSAHYVGRYQENHLDSPGVNPLYEAAMSLARSWTCRYPMFEYQGTFGSAWGDVEDAIALWTDRLAEGLARPQPADTGDRMDAGG